LDDEKQQTGSQLPQQGFPGDGVPFFELTLPL